MKTKLLIIIIPLFFSVKCGRNKITRKEDDTTKWLLQNETELNKVLNKSFYWLVGCLWLLVFRSWYLLPTSLILWQLHLLFL
jgi:hypothetical protein